jgi:hypothetical protein
MWYQVYIYATEADPGSGESGVPGRFTLKFMVNFNDVFRIPKFLIKFYDFFANKSGHAPTLDLCLHHNSAVWKIRNCENVMLEPRFLKVFSGKINVH